MNDHTTSDADLPDERPPSKSHVKREMHALQDLGRQMLEMKPDQLADLPISERLRVALQESSRIRQNEARRRHLQYIGKIIREEDDLERLRRAIAALDSGSEEHTRRQHLAEQWREQLVAGDNDALTSFVALCPEADVQHLRNLVRNARQDLARQKNTGHGKKLFRYLRECIDTLEQSS